VSTRLDRLHDGDTEAFIELAGRKWHRARETDPSVMTPELPKHGQEAS